MSAYPEKMTLPAKVSFELGAAGGVRKATEHFLNLAGIPFKNGSAGRFVASNEDGTFMGVRAILSVARSVASGSPVELLGANPSERVVVDQWVATALQVNSDAVPLLEVEPMIPSRGYLAGGKQASVGDLFLYCVAAETALNNSSQYPNLAAWAKGMERNDLFAQVKVEVAATSSPTAGGDAAKKEEGGKGGKGGKEKAARPSEEQLAKLRAEKEAAKAAKEAAKKAEGGDADKDAKPKKEDKKKKVVEVTGADLDLRIGHVISCEKHPESEKLYIEKIELGDPEGPRTILSGLQKDLKAEDIAGQNVLVLCNMKPKPLAGIPSHGMVLCASNPEGQLCLVTSPDAKPGTRVVVGTSEVPEALAPVPSSKVMDELTKHFSSNASGVVHWQDKPLLVGGKNEIIAKLPNALIK